MNDSRPILIVEDSDDDFEVTERALKRDGNLRNPIVRCEDGEDALDFLQGEGEFASDTPVVPAMILLDLNMPGMDGRAVLRHIKQQEELNDIPVIVLTTSDDERDIEDCYRHGANTYIKKPVDLDNFFEAIKRLKDFWFDVAILPKR